MDNVASQYQDTPATSEMTDGMIKARWASGLYRTLDELAQACHCTVSDCALALMPGSYRVEPKVYKRG